MGVGTDVGNLVHISDRCKANSSKWSLVLDSSTLLPGVCILSGLLNSQIWNGVKSPKARNIYFLFFQNNETCASDDRSYLLALEQKCCIIDDQLKKKVQEGANLKPIASLTFGIPVFGLSFAGKKWHFKCLLGSIPGKRQETTDEDGQSPGGFNLDSKCKEANASFRLTALINVKEGEDDI